MDSATRLRDLAAELAGLPPAEAHARLRQLAGTLPLPERFALLHRLGVYHHPESLSGAASTLRETARLRAALPQLIAEERVQSLLDLPCGDFSWMQLVPLDVEYTGADVVLDLVQANADRYGGGRRRFLILDATRDLLPAVDLILCRDLLVHLSLADIAAVLRSFVASGSRLLLTSHFTGRADNPDILSGDFRAVNLCRPPFHLPPPRRVVMEDSELADGAFRDRAMALWRLADIAAVLGSR